MVHLLCDVSILLNSVAELSNGFSSRLASFLRRFSLIWLSHLTYILRRLYKQDQIFRVGVSSYRMDCTALLGISKNAISYRVSILIDF